MIREVNQETIDLIKKFEGCKLHVYKDAIGLPTIGIGHLITKGEEFTEITEEEAENLLKKDLQQAVNAVLRLIKVSLTDNQFGALVSFCFNCGSGSLQRSTLRAKLNREEYNDVPAEFLKWNKAGGKVFKGLTRRREAEAALFAA